MGKYNTFVILDNGHNILTPGKCSPDGRVKEYLLCNKLATAIQNRLLDFEIPSIMVHPELDRVGATEAEDLKIRIKRANTILRHREEKNFIFVSIHLNAAADVDKSGWAAASGFTPYVYEYASTKSKQLATCFYDNAKQLGILGNRKYDKYAYGNFAVLRQTKMPAVLTENMFMTNEKDVDFLCSESGFETLVTLHVNSILDYANIMQDI